MTDGYIERLKQPNESFEHCPATDNLHDFNGDLLCEEHLQRRLAEQF